MSAPSPVPEGLLATVGEHAPARRRPPARGGDAELVGWWEDPRHPGRASSLAMGRLPVQLLGHDQEEARELDLELVALIGQAWWSRTWLARGASGELRVARRLPERPAYERGDAVAALVRLISLRAPGLLAPTQLMAGVPIWVARRFSSGIPLRRLVAVASLTPAQVTALSRDVATTVSALHEAGLAHGSLHAGNVIVGVDGRARLSDAGIATSALEPGARRRDLDALRGLVAALAPRRSRPVPPHAAPRDRGGAPPPGGGCPEGDRPLLIRLASADEPPPAVRRQLAALVDRLSLPTPRLRPAPRGA